MPDALSSPLTLEQSLLQARQLIGDGMYENADFILQDCWLSNPDDLQVLALYVRLMKESGRQPVHEKLDQLLGLLEAEKKAVGEENKQQTDFSVDGDDEKAIPLAIFDSAYALIDIRHFALAVMLLERCNKMQPNDPTVRYELGFALMALGRVRDAVPHFYDAYREAQDFDTTLNLSVCHMLLREVSKTRQYTEELLELSKEPEEVKEAGHRRVSLKRLEEFTAKKTLTKQDWLYILYGGVILSSKERAGTPGGEHGSKDPRALRGPVKEEEKNIAEVLLLLKGLLEGLRQEPELIEYYNTQSRPLAKICSELMELPMDSYRGPNRPERCLLIMDWATDLIGPHEVFVENRENRIIFAYAMSQAEPLPVVPDIIGCFAHDPVMPWDNKTRDEISQSIGSRVLDKARDLETDPDIIKLAQDLLSYYEPRRTNLVLGNAQGFPERPEYSAEIQAE